MPGAIDAVKLSKQKGRIVAIISSGTRKYINLALEIFDLKQYVDYIVGGEDVERGKPYPDVYQKAYSFLPDKSIKKQNALLLKIQQTEYWLQKRQV